MTAEEKNVALARLERAKATRALYRNVYQKDDAIVSIAQMMDDAGYYSTNPETVKPELVAAVNRLLSSIGSVHPGNVFSFAKAIVGTANDDDIEAQLTAIAAAREE